MSIEKQSGDVKKAGDLMTVKLTLAVDDIRRQADFHNTIRVFGVDGVGGITSDRVCVKVDRRKAEVWLSEGLYSALYEKSKQPHLIKEELRKPDEKILGDYTPIFKALSNCGISIDRVNRSSPEKLLEVRTKLGEQHEIIRSIKNKFRAEAYLISDYGPVAFAEARQRYEKNKIATQEVKRQPDFRLQMEWVLLEKEIAQQLREMNEYEVFKVLATPEGERVNIHGKKGIGVIVAPLLVVQIDNKKAKVFLEQEQFSKFSAQLSGKTAEEICGEICKNPKLVGEELRSFSSLFAALSETEIKVTELSGKTPAELKEIAEKLVEQNWIASQLMRAPATSRGKVAKQILESVKSAKRVDEALARYGIEIAVEPRRKAPEPSEELRSKILGKLRLLEFEMVDERVDGIEILGMAGFFAINVNGDAIIKVRGKKASFLLTQEFYSFLSERMRTKGEFETLRRNLPGLPRMDEARLLFKHPQLLEGERKLLPYLSATEALKEYGVEDATFKLVRHDADYYMGRVRREFDIPSKFSRKLKERSFSEVVDEMLTVLPATELVAKLNNAGMEREVERVAKYVDALRSTKREVKRMLDEWVERGVPTKQEMMGEMNPELFERTLKEVIAELTESNEKLSKRIMEWRKKLNEPRYFSSASQDMLREFIQDDTNTVESNKKIIQKAQEALKVLEGKDES